MEAEAMRKSDTNKSRRKTPWDGADELTPIQTFLKDNYEIRYGNHHRKVADSDESDMVNSFAPTKCPYCMSEDFKRSGYTDSGVQRYKCNCRKTFLPTTGTIFDDHKLSISEWMEYCLNLFRHVSITADSWNNKNAFNTSRYWLQKLFLTLEGVQDNIMLSGTVWLDETYYRVRAEDVVRDEEGGKLKGISRNQLRIAVATDKENSVFIYEGTGKPSQKRTFETFVKRIAPASTLIHDKETAHKKLISKLGLNSISYSSKELKVLLDKDNPLYPVNRAHAILKMFLNAHGGFKREHLQGYLNLFALVTNPPHEMLEKVEIVINSAFATPKTLRFRDFYASNTEF
jgi:transposase-like protein